MAGRLASADATKRFLQARALADTSDTPDARQTERDYRDTVFLPKTDFR